MGALSSEYKKVGIPISNGIRLAVDIANREGGLACGLAVHAEDTQGDPNQAPRKASILTEDDQVVACICGFFSGETLASGAIFSKAGLAMVSTGTYRVIKRQGFKTWFRAIASDRAQGVATTAYIKAGLRADRVSVVHDGQFYSKGLANDVANGLGDRLAGKYRINPEESDHSAVVAKIKRQDPDVVYYGGYAPQAGDLLAQLHDAGVPALFLTDDGALDSYLQRSIRTRHVKAKAACPCSDPAQIEAASDFVKEYEASYGTPPEIYSADAFDVTNIAIDALRDLTGVEPTVDARQAVVDYFDSADGIAGTVKTYGWSERGEFKAGNDELFIWKWDNAAHRFEMLGRVSDFV
jgi:branched-chain amino acid transport system substrate-binding protein